MTADQLFTSVERRAATASGLATRLENLYAGLPETRAELLADIAHYQREVDVNAPRIDAVFSRAEELQTKQVRLRQLRMEIEQAQQSPEAVAARQAAEQRMLAAGRSPGWSLELNPTVAAVEEAGLTTVADYVAATKREHSRNAAHYRFEHGLPEHDGPRITTLLEATRPTGPAAATPTERESPTPPPVEPPSPENGPDLDQW